MATGLLGVTMRLTNVLNFGLLALVLVVTLGGFLTWVGISSLRAHLEIAHASEAIHIGSDGLNEALRQFQQGQNDETEQEVRQQLALLNDAISKLALAGAPPDIVDDLRTAGRHYASAFDAYVQQRTIKLEALAVVSSAATDLRDRASHEAGRIEQENARALDRAEDIERLQAESSLAAQRVNEILVAISRMRQAVDVLVRTGDQGPKRTVTAAFDRIQANLDDINGMGEGTLELRRLAIVGRWLDIYSTLIARLSDADLGEGEIDKVRARISQTAVPLQTEADRLRDAIQDILRSAISDANVERDRLFDVSRRNGHLGRMHQSLSEVMTQVRLLKVGIAPDRLVDDMSRALEALDRSTKALFSPAEQAAWVDAHRSGQTPPSVDGPDGGTRGMAAEILELEGAWTAAIAAASEGQARAVEMAEAASDTEDVIDLARQQVDDTLDRAFEKVLIIISIAMVITILVSALGAAYVYRHVTQPLATLTNSIASLAKGDLEAPIPLFRSAIELTELAEAAEVLRRASLHRLDLERENARKERRIAKERAEAEKLDLLLRQEQEKMQLQRKFVAMVSHEFRTPLAIIDGQAQGVLRRLDRVEPDALANRMTKVKTAVERLIALMETMLTSSRLEAGTIEFKPKVHDLRELVEEICAHQRDVSPSHDIVVNVEALPHAYEGDPRLLRQVMTNLLSNAVKYSPDAKRVDVTAVEDDHSLHIHVRDYGVGIPEEELPKLSQQFFRASTSTGISGTGIGLNLVRAFIDMHGGSMTVSSIVDEGSTFSIHLPSLRKSLAA